MSYANTMAANALERVTALEKEVEELKKAIPKSKKALKAKK